MSRVYLIRHPLIEGDNTIKHNYNCGRLTNGWADGHNSGWWKQAGSLAAKIARENQFHTVFTSQTHRTNEPAEFIAGRLYETQGLLHMTEERKLEGNQDVGVVVSNLFIERELGDLTADMVYEIDTGGVHTHNYVFGLEDIPRGESKTEFRKRVQEAHDGYIKPFLDTNKNLAVLDDIFWHNEYLDLMLGGQRRFRRIPNLGVSVLEFSGNGAREI